MGRIVDIDQQTDAWLDWRKRGLGASEAPTIMGENPYQDDFVLWQLRTGRRQPKKEYAQADGRPDPRAHGKAHEDQARDKLCAELGMLLYPVCMEHDTIPFMFASFDAFNEDDWVGAEIKSPDDIRNHLLAREGRVPPEYRAQLQHQLEVARTMDRGFPRWLYYSYWAETDEGILLEVESDPDYIDYKLIPAEERFWGWIQADAYPLPVGEAVLKPDDPINYAMAQEMIKKWANYKAMEEEAHRLQEAARADLLRLMDGKAKVKIGDLAVLTRSYRRGNIDYWNLPGFKNLIAGKTDDEIRFPGSLDFRVRRLK